MIGEACSMNVQFAPGAVIAPSDGIILGGQPFNSAPVLAVSRRTGDISELDPVAASILAMTLA